MAKLTVTFQDAEEAVITGYYASPQDPAVYPFLGEVEDDDQRFLEFQARQTPEVDYGAVAAADRDRLLGTATLRIAPLQDAVDLDDATAAEVALLKKWKQFRVAVNRVDLTEENPAWPEQPK